MFRVLDRYVYREMLPIFVLAVGLFTFLHVMDRLQDFSNMAANGAPLHLVLRLWGLLVLSFLSHTFPMGLLMAVVTTCGRLASDLEVVALKASGVSPLRLFRPFLVAAIFVSSVMMALTLWINPWGSAAFFRCLHELRRHTAVPLIQERTFTRIGDLVVYTEKVDLATSELQGVLVADERDPKTIGIITAPRGRLIDDDVRPRTMLRLTGGVAHESRPESPDWYRVTGFDVYETPLDVGTQIAEAEKDAGPQKKLSTWDLLVNTRALDFSRRAEKAEMFVVEFHKRLALPLAPIVFAMVAFPLGIRLHRGGQAVAAVGGIIVYLVHHVAQEGLIRVAVLRPWGGGRWLPIILFALVGGVLLYFTVTPAPTAWRRGAARLLELLPTRWFVLHHRPTPTRPRQLRRRRQSSLVDRYLARQFLVYVVYGLGIATAIFIVVDLVETLSRYEPPLRAIFEHFVYRLPAALHQALPIVVLTATIFLFMELERYHELTALKAAGISLHRASAPILVLAAAVSVGAFVFQETAAPVLNAKGDEVDRVEIRKSAAPRSEPQLQWYRRSDSEFARVDRLDRARRLVNGVTFLEIDENFKPLKRLDMGQAVWVRDGLEFGRTVVREFGPGTAIRTISSSETPVRLAESLEALGATPVRPSAMTFMELRAYVRQLRDRGHAVGNQLLHLHSKLSFPLMSFVLAILAISCTARWPRGGRLIGGAIAVVITVAYWVVNSGALSLGRVDLLPPIVAAWAANIVFGGIGVSLFFRTPT
jgi:LPS export ABC transporter permease LptF/LPS export ABC transporter permease LptG